MKLYFKANNITEDSKKAFFFLSALGYETYEILVNIFTNPETEEFDTLGDRLTNHFTLNHQLLLSDTSLDAVISETQKV